ncbi:MAG TPA: hypothetical protein VF855_04900 [Acidimicrobiales bacterium]
MPTELEQQLPRFAEALDREAPAISVDEILGRGTVVVDVDHLDRPSWDEVPRIAAVPSGDATPDHSDNRGRDASIELVWTAAEPPTRRRVALRVALAAAAAAVVLVVAIASIERIDNEPDPADVPPSTVTTSPPTTTASLTSGGKWPQSTIEEVRAAQERADAGDPAYTWQLGAQLSEDDPSSHVNELELVDRFMHEVLGWDAYLFYAGESGDDDGWAGGAWTDQRYLRCAPGRTNPLYPPLPDSEQPSESCAPTIDDLRYESVILDLAQFERLGRDGIWVVNRWRLTAPYAQADPAAVKAQATEQLEEFLAARVAGNGAEGHLRVNNDIDVPLLYRTTSGAPYERYEIERIDGPKWPNGFMTFSARLFSAGDATVVEQEIRWSGPRELWLDVNSTTENGQPVVLSYTSSDGEVTMAASSTWRAWLPGRFSAPVYEGQFVQRRVDVWSGWLYHSEDNLGGGERIELADPVAYDGWCAANGGTPLLTAPADAASITQQLVADPNFETTAPVTARVGGLEAVSVDVSLAPGGEGCQVGITDISRWIHTIGWKPGWRLRLYLVDLPEGMSVPTLAITVVAPEERFDEVIAETAPIIDSIEFHPKSA